MVAKEDAKTNVSMLQLKVARAANRRHWFNPILFGGKLFQQWVVDSYLQIEPNNLNLIKAQQSKVRVELYRVLMEHLNNTANNLAQPVERVAILPFSFQVSPMSVRDSFHDVMTIVSKCGKPDIFFNSDLQSQTRLKSNPTFFMNNSHQIDPIWWPSLKIKLAELLDDI